MIGLGTQEVEAFGQSNDARQTDRSRRMLNLERATAELIQILVFRSAASVFWK